MQQCWVLVEGLPRAFMLFEKIFGKRLEIFLIEQLRLQVESFWASMSRKLLELTFAS